ncbi:hypothetical protein ILUMI_02805 [Ignelater luminosus]|uniref:Uncharacterized protein n=1 Tax=Ignelater luminosus TaxID=2038154 RepID=A0A8K0DHP1_IGNLU|nr:hypothetical protein ILUMI_02805 [Ignelater luminosus]
MTVGPYREQDVNDNGERLIEICQQYSLRIQNGFYKHKDFDNYTWTQLILQRKSKIDYIITRQISRIRLYDVRVYRGAECGTDHHLVTAKTFYHLITHSGSQSNYREKRKIRYKLNGLKDEWTVFPYKMRLNA